jgi:hypothetical protein
VNLVWAFVWNCGNQFLDAKGEAQMDTTIRARIPMQEIGADQSVVAKKASNAAGAKRLN